ncbi:MAG: FAD-binding oxidoreductase [Steroidobacteraceae bacterium]|nr:FAD-binding oxidoreductase [Steroidobacteraceae bacterium]
MKRRTFLVGSATAALCQQLLRDRAWASIPLPDTMTATRLDGSTVLLNRATVADLRDGLRGPLLFRGEAGYDEARKVWNASIDRRPALIARCTGAADVSRVLQFASAHRLLVAVRGGGHSASGASVCEGGLMLDLSLMQSVRVDPRRATARVEPGVLLGAVDRETLSFGLVTTTGMVSHTGAAGLTLGGGCGRLARRFGLAVDNVTGVDIVSPDGVLRAASAAENSDLHWAVRGGSGNFGVVTSFEYRLHPFEPLVFGGTIQFSYKDARDVLRFFAEFVADAPDSLWATVNLGDTESKNRDLTIDICFSGEAAAGEKLLKPLRRFRKPLRDEIRLVDYRKLQTSLDVEGRHGLLRYQTSGYLLRLENGLIDAVLAQFEDTDAMPLRVLIMSWGGGQIARIPREATAYWHRDVRWNVNVAASWTDPAENDSRKQRVRDAWKALEPMTHGFYANSITGRGSDAMRGTYGANYDRLARIKRIYDPNNQLRMNANVLPASS